MPDLLNVFVNGKPIRVSPGSVVSAAILQAEVPCRISVTGQPRTALCGMGICFECRATVDGVAHRRTCQLLCRDGMQVETQQ